jgi:hypothetical protein
MLPVLILKKIILLDILFLVVWGLLCIGTEFWELNGKPLKGF